jgi:hypothetical protein
MQGPYNIKEIVMNLSHHKIGELFDHMSEDYDFKDSALWR